MVRRIKTWYDLQKIDVPEAIKRALVKRGIVHTLPETSKTASEEDKPSSDDKDDEDKNKERKKLIDLAVQAHEVLFKVNTVFPFTLFPDTITLDREKLTIAKRSFWRVAKITSSPVQDIQSAEADVGPIFGSIHLTSRYFFTNQRSVRFLWREDAIRLRHLIQGYIIAQERKIDCSDIPKDRLVAMLSRLGQGETD